MSEHDRLGRRGTGTAIWAGAVVLIVAMAAWGSLTPTPPTASTPPTLPNVPETSRQPQPATLVTIIDPFALRTVTLSPVSAGGPMSPLAALNVDPRVVRIPSRPSLRSAFRPTW